MLHMHFIGYLSILLISDWLYLSCLFILLLFAIENLLFISDIEGMHLHNSINNSSGQWLNAAY